MILSGPGSGSRVWYHMSDKVAVVKEVLHASGEDLALGTQPQPLVQLLSLEGKPLLEGSKSLRTLRQYTARGFTCAVIFWSSGSFSLLMYSSPVEESRGVPCFRICRGKGEGGY